MAQTLRLSQLERAFYVRNTTGVDQNTPFGQLQRDYFIQYLNNVAVWNKNTPMDQLEIDWAHAYIVANGGTVTDRAYLSSAWKNLVAVLGQTPTNNMTQNKRIFFYSAP